jgi:hypothetical protein
MVGSEAPPTVNDTIRDAESFIVLSNGNLVNFDDLLKPGYSVCNNCALKARGNRLKEDGVTPNPLFIPSTCPVYERGRHCLIEEAVVIETVQSFKTDGLETLDKYMMFSLLTNMLNLHRLGRVGQVIDFSRMHQSKEQAEILQKYISMTTSANNQFTKAIKELTLSRKDRVLAEKSSTTNAASVIQANINKAIELEEEDEDNDEPTSDS